MFTIMAAEYSKKHLLSSFLNNSRNTLVPVTEEQAKSYIYLCKITDWHRMCIDLINRHLLPHKEQSTLRLLLTGFSDLGLILRPLCFKSSPCMRVSKQITLFWSVSEELMLVSFSDARTSRRYLSFCCPHSFGSRAIHWGIFRDFLIVQMLI